MEIDERKSCNLFKSRAFKETTKVTCIDHCTITIEMKIKAITKYKIQVERKWVLTHDRIERFREKTNNNKKISDFNLLLSDKLNYKQRKRNIVKIMHTCFTKN